MLIGPVKLEHPLRVLLVDDSRAIQAIIKRAVAKCGYEPVEILTASDGAQGMQMAVDYAPDLIITDWHMPNMSGLEMVQAIRQKGFNKTRVGFVTTERTESLLEEARQSGAAFILNKPFEDEELIEAVRDNVTAVVDARNIPEVNSSKAEGIGPTSQHLIAKQIAIHFGNLPFRIVETDKVRPEHLTPSILLGLYTRATHKGVYAVGMMDMNSVCIVGGGYSRKTPAEVRNAMQSGIPDKEMLASAQEFLNQMGNNLFSLDAQPVSPVKLSNSSIVKKTFAKLAEVLSHEEGRADFRIAVPGYGEGKISFIYLQPNQTVS